MKLEIGEYIKIWDDRKRRYSYLKYRTKEEFWNQKNNFKM
jgi:hypothetical protein